MDLTLSPRHTRRGFLRGGAAQKFYPVSEKLDANLRDGPGERYLPPPTHLPETQSQSPFPAPPRTDLPFPDAMQGPALSQLIANGDANVLQAIYELKFDPEYESSALTQIQSSLLAPSSNAFLSWLAEQLEGKSVEEYDPYVESAFWHEDDDDDFSLAGCEFEAAYADEIEDEPPTATPGHWHRQAPAVEVGADGWRIELFFGGSKIVKDALGRVVEVHSQFGEAMHFRYAANGIIETFQRYRADGTSHSGGERDRHGVVVRDADGRVKAAGESMTIDPRGSFFLHTFEGQFFSLDLVSGIHTERRKISDETGVSRFVTSLFTHDGFRMATMFGGLKGSTAYGGGKRTPKFRFYGRDGTLIEFNNDEDLHLLHPSNVMKAGTRKVSRSWPHERQANTAWDAVRDYLMRVS